MARIEGMSRGRTLVARLAFFLSRRSYADAMTSAPVRVPDAVFEALKARYTDRQILEITAAIAWEIVVAQPQP